MVEVVAFAVGAERRSESEQISYFTAQATIA